MIFLYISQPKTHRKNFSLIIKHVFPPLLNLKFITLVVLPNNISTKQSLIHNRTLKNSK